MRRVQVSSASVVPTTREAWPLVDPLLPVHPAQQEVTRRRQVQGSVPHRGARLVQTRARDQAPIGGRALDQTVRGAALPKRDQAAGVQTDQRRGFSEN